MGSDAESHNLQSTKDIPLRIFVSHSHKDDDITARLVKDLRRAGATVWVDTTNLEHGDFMERINQALAECDWLVLVQSPNSLRSKPVRQEVNAALRLVWQGRIKDVIPFIVDPCDEDDIPAVWGTLHYYDATLGYEEAFAGLVKALGLKTRNSSQSRNQIAGTSKIALQTQRLHDDPSISQPDLIYEGEMPHITSTTVANLEHMSNAQSDVSAEDHSTSDSYCMHKLDTAMVFAISNQNGRVGKTATATNLGAYLAYTGQRVLIVDLSPTAAASLCFIDEQFIEYSVYDFLISDSFEIDSIVRELRPNLHILPASSKLWTADQQLPFMKYPEFRLAHGLDSVRSSFDFILIDCPSWLGLLTTNAFVASDGVIVPYPCEEIDLAGLSQLLNMIRLIRDRFNQRLCLFGLAMTMYDPHSDHAEEVLAEFNQHFPKEKFETLIPHDIRVREATSYRRTILEHDPHSRGALAYKALAEEVVARAAFLLPTYEY